MLGVLSIAGTDVAEPGRGILFDTFRALKHRNFRLFFIGQLLSLVGTWMQSLAQGWLVWRLTESTWLLGLLGFFQMAPVLLFGLAGGIVADRFPRHKIVLATQSAAAIQATVLAMLTLLGVITVPEIFLLAAILGLVNAFDMPGRQAFLVEMVGREDLGNAIALNSSVFNGARVVGPALAGLVVQVWGEGICFALNAFSFLAVLGGLVAMRVDSPPRREAGRGAWMGLKEGLAYAWGTRHVRSLLILVMVTSLFALSYSALLPAVVGGILKRDASGMGILMSSGGLGALLGALNIARRKGTHGLGRIAGLSAASFGALLVLLAASRSMEISVAVMFGMGYAMMSQLAATNTTLQAYVPERLRGRLMSLYTVAFIGMTPLGSVVLGKVAARFGTPAALYVGGGITLATGLIFLTTIRRDRASVAEAASQASEGP
jgi:MFS family permease